MHLFIGYLSSKLPPVSCLFYAATLQLRNLGGLNRFTSEAPRRGPGIW